MGDPVLKLLNLRCSCRCHRDGEETHGECCFIVAARERDALGSAPSPGAAAVREAERGTFPGQHPPPHAVYVVRRGGVTVTAKVCYGMHSPWWVVQTLEGDSAPVPMQDGDEWCALKARA